MVKYVLSLSGGGIRGAITVAFLEEFEQFLFRNEGKSIFNKFDLYSGSSTGALICSGIAHECLTAKELTNTFYTHKTAKRLMNQSWKDYFFGLVQNCPKYDGIGKREIIEELARDKFWHETDKDIVVPIYDITKEEPIFVKSWESESLRITDVLDSTSAAPGYFPSVEYKPGHWAIDGSVISHNPSMTAYIDAKELYPNEEIILLSIGTGQSYPENIGSRSRNWGGIEWAIQGNLSDILFNAPMEAQIKYTHKLVQQNGDKFIHIDGFIKNCAMDDISETNIELLKDIGRKLWKTNEIEIKEIFCESDKSRMFKKLLPQFDQNLDHIQNLEQIESILL